VDSPPQPPSHGEGGENTTALAPSDHASPYPVSRLAPPFGLVDLAREIQDADRVLGAVVGGQLEVIAEQIRGLQERARDILERADRAGQLHRAACNFRKRPGATYHLYRRPSGELYFSMLSPEDWGGSGTGGGPPHPFEGSYRLEVDMSWTRVDSAI
jgi:hypothetical protein